MDPLDGILAWCSEMAPETAASVRAPASEEEFWQAHRGTGGSIWPDQVVAFYRWCDGTERTPDGYLLPRYRPLSSGEIAEVWQLLMLVDFPESKRAEHLVGAARESAFAEIAGEVSVRLPQSREKAGTEAGLFIPSFLPIAEDQSGSYLMVDQRPGPRRGCVFVFDRDNADNESARWKSLGVLWQKIYEAMQKGKVVDGTRYRPVALGGQLTWDVG